MGDELYKISVRGNVKDLMKWRDKNPHIPLNQKFTAHCRTPLHLAAMHGHVKFVEKLLSYESYDEKRLTMEVDSHGFTPLHLVSARSNHILVVKKLLAANNDACMHKDEEGRTPLYLAAMKDQVNIVKELINEKPEAIHIRYDQNETILHVCVKHNRLDSLVLLVNKLISEGEQSENMDAISVNSTKDDGNTILHLAAELKRWKCIRYLTETENIGIKMNTLNNNGVKALHILPETERDILETGSYKKKGKRSSQDWLKERVNALMVVATLIAGIAFQAAMNPPGGVFQDDSVSSSSDNPILFSYYLGEVAKSSKSSNFDKYLIKTLAQDTNQTQNTTEIVKSAKFVQALLDTLKNESYTEAEAGYAYVTSKHPGIVLEEEKWNEIITKYKPEFAPYLIRYAGTPILAYKRPRHYRIYMTCNAIAFIFSLSIIMLVISGFIYSKSTDQHIRVLVGMMVVSIVVLFMSYALVFINMSTPFYENKSEFRAALYATFPIMFICMIYIGVNSRKQTEILEEEVLEDYTLGGAWSHLKAFLMFIPVCYFLFVLILWNPILYW
ncbi:hypothetical protein MKW92_023372 [Papaver armeniacum]|nr:hypothetical protein MKW92_023372 [Papaver armeniacum]